MNANVLGVITARGGSKGIPGKNIKLFLGKPLIAHTIEAAVASHALDRIILSTDDQEIADVAKQYGCEIPFMRPKELAEDKTPHLPVMQHAVKWLRENEGYEPEYTLILQPTSPLREPRHIAESVELIKKYKSDSVISLTLIPLHFNPHWQFLLKENYKLEIFTGESFRDIIKRRQELPPTCTKNGSIFLFKTKLLFDKDPSIYGDDVRGYFMDEKYNLNIDTLEEWELAEKVYKK